MIDTEIPQESIGYVKISKFEEILGGPEKKGPHKNTIDGWFKKLEKQNVHYVQRIGKEKVYDDLDLNIAQFIWKKRDENWAIDAIFDEIKSGRAGLEIRGEDINSDSQSLDQSHLAILLEKISDLERMTKETVQSELKMQQQLLIEDKEAARRKRFDDMITQRRVYELLRKEARLKWEEKSEEERFIVVGGFFKKKKIENLEKKNEFIEDYISTHYEAALKNEFGYEIQIEQQTKILAEVIDK